MGIKNGSKKMPVTPDHGLSPSMRNRLVILESARNELPESLGPLHSSGEALGTSEELIEWVIVTYHPDDEFSGDSDEVLHSMAVFREARELAVEDLELNVAV